MFSLRPLAARLKSLSSPREGSESPGGRSGAGADTVLPYLEESRSEDASWGEQQTLPGPEDTAASLQRTGTPGSDPSESNSVQQHRDAARALTLLSVWTEEDEQRRKA